MPMPTDRDALIQAIDDFLKQLQNTSSEHAQIELAINTANHILCLLGIDEGELKTCAEIEKTALPASDFTDQKIEKWFVKHRYMSEARVAFRLYGDESRNEHPTYPLMVMFYAMNEPTTKAKIARTTQLRSANWEDSELTMHENWKVGIDFIFKPQSRSLLFIITKKTNLRVLELSERLSNTQKQLLGDLASCFRCVSMEQAKTADWYQRRIHERLWKALELEQVNKQFYEGISGFFHELCDFLMEHHPRSCSENDIKLFVNRLIGRLLFVWFLRKKKIIAPEARYFAAEDSSSTDYYDRKLKKLFFKTLNTPIDLRADSDDKKTPYLNGGLFEPHRNDYLKERIEFPKTWFVRLYEHLDKYNFTTDESSPEYEQVAIDPEMLGRVFEELLAKITSADNKSERNEKGAFYTPREIVSYMCREALKAYLKKTLHDKSFDTGIDRLIDSTDADFLKLKSTGPLNLWGIRTKDVQQQILEALNSMKVLDPACGSGAYPIGFMQLLLQTYERISAIYDHDKQTMVLSRKSVHADTYDIKLFIIGHLLYGVDIEPMGVEISRLRTWLSLIIDKKNDEIVPLPNLDFHFICANSLVRLTGETSLFNDDSLYEQLDEVQQQYFNAHDVAEKDKLKARFKAILYRPDDNPYRGEDDEQLKTWYRQVFDNSQPASFFDGKKMLNVDKFSVVIGNPPYIHFEKMKPAERELYRRLSESSPSHDPYMTYAARGDIYTLFFEMGLNNLEPGGVLCYITSNKWMRAGYGQGLRKFLVTDQACPRLLLDLGPDVFKSATVDTSILLVTKDGYTEPTKAATISVNVADKTDFHKAIINSSVFITFKPDDVWSILSPIELSIKEKIEKYGTPLKEWPGLKINYGIKTGCNEAFIINEQTRKDILDNCATPEERQRTDELIRPILRGRDIGRYQYNWTHIYVILAAFGSHRWLEKECPAIFRHLSQYKVKLSNRGQCRYLSNGKTNDPLSATYPGYPGMHHWLELDNNPRQTYLDDFNKPKIIYSEIVRGPQFCLDLNKNLIEATAFVLSGDDLDILITYLNSPIISWCFKRFYSGGGLGQEGFRYKKVFLEQLPIPRVRVTEDDIPSVLHLSPDELMWIQNH